MAAEKWEDKMQDTFQYSFEKFESEITRMESLQKTYDNKVDPDIWPTKSKIPLPIAWATVEEAVGPAMDYLMPPQPSIRLVPRDDVDQDIIDKAQWAVHLMLKSRMKIKPILAKAVKDCFKVGVGYAIVEPITVTPPDVFTVVSGNNQARIMGKGKAVRSLQLRYLSPGKVIPYPEGTDFNEEAATPYSFLLDTIPEAQFRKLFKDEPRAGQEVLLKGDVDEMVKIARSNGFSTESSMVEFMEKMGGRPSMIGVNRSVKKTVPCVVPVMKCYARDEGRHTWFFCNANKWEILWDKYDSHDTMRNPCIKCDPWLDSDRWVGMSQPEADERTTHGKNLLFNAMMDIMGQSLKRPVAWNSNDGDDPPDFDGGIWKVNGEVDKQVRVIEPADLSQGSFSMMDVIDGQHAQNTGQRDFTQKNFTRGGSQAFNDLLGTSGARDRLRWMLLETGGFESIVMQTILYMQTLGAGMDFTFNRPAYSVTAGKQYIESFSITENDMKHAYDVDLDLDSKSRQGSQDINTRLQVYNAKMSSDAWDKWAIQEDLETDPYKLERQRLPREEVLAKQKATEDAELAALQQTGQPQGAETQQVPAVAGAIQGGTPA